MYNVLKWASQRNTGTKIWLAFKTSQLKSSRRRKIRRERLTQKEKQRDEPPRLVLACSLQNQFFPKKFPFLPTNHIGNKKLPVYGREANSTKYALVKSIHLIVGIHMCSTHLTYVPLSNIFHKNRFAMLSLGADFFKRFQMPNGHELGT
jgi:hypothetical protein